MARSRANSIKQDKPQRRPSLRSLDQNNKVELPDHEHFDETDSEDMSRKQDSPQLRMNSVNRPKSQIKKNKKSILLKKLHEKSSTVYLAKTREKNNADLSNVSDSPKRHMRGDSGFGKSSTVKKQHMKFEFGGSSHKFITDASPIKPNYN